MASSSAAAQNEAANAARRDGEPDRPLGSYAVLSGGFGLVCGLFGVWMRRSGRSLPERVALGDFLLVSLATHKLARLITKDRVTSILRRPFTEYQEDGGPGEVEEAPRGRGLRRAIGELLVCPYCIGLWLAAAFTGGLVVVARPTRWIASVFATLFCADVLQIAYKKLEDTL